jgi:hypothetical protein
MPPRPIAAPPRRLTQQQLTYFMLGLPIGLIAVGVALAGLVVVWGECLSVPRMALLGPAAHRRRWQHASASACLACGCCRWCVCHSPRRRPGAHARALSLPLWHPADSKQQWAVSQSDFAALWRRAVDHNPFIQAFMLNFGAIGACVCARVWWLAACGVPAGRQRATQCWTDGQPSAQCAAVSIWAAGWHVSPRS